LGKVYTHVHGQVTLQHADVPDNYTQISQKNEAFPLVKCIGRYVYNGPAII